MESEPTSCAICLENLLPLDGGSSLQSSLSGTETSSKVGAVVPCGHVFHHACYRRWHTAQKRRFDASIAGSNPRNKFSCKCPMCNIPCDNFVKLFLGDHDQKKITAQPSLPSPATSFAGSNEEGEEDESILLLARTCHDSAKRLDRVKDKLNRYKKETRTLEKKLEDERRHNEQSMERTMERHAKERRSWKRQQGRLQDDIKSREQTVERLKDELEEQRELVETERRKWRNRYKRLEQQVEKDAEASQQEFLDKEQEWQNRTEQMQNELEAVQRDKEIMMEEIDRTVELQVEERRNWERRLKAMEEELAKAQADKEKADARVQKAAKGIAQMQIYNDIRREQLNKANEEKNALSKELFDLKASLSEEIVFEE